MEGKRKFLLTLLFIVLCFVLLLVFLLFNQRTTSREEDSLLNQYYHLLRIDPLAAKRALQLIIEQKPHDQEALREMGYWYLRQGDTNSALKQFEIAVANNPNDYKASYELAKLYILIRQYNKARPLLTKLSQLDDFNIRQPALTLLKQLPPPVYSLPIVTYIMPPADLKTALTNYILTQKKLDTIKANVTVIAQLPPIKISTPKPQPTISKHDQLLNQYYEAKKTKNNAQAWRALNALLALYPNDVNALKEGGYFALAEKNNALAYRYFYRAHALTLDPKLAMQIGYILTNLKLNRIAYHYFDLATQNKEVAERYKAEIAMTNLRGVQTRILPENYYFDVTFTPFHYSRFHLIVYPEIARLVKLVNAKYQWEWYIKYRRTTDNRSGGGGQLSQIFNDSVAIYSLGTQVVFFPKIPLIGFVEAGKARNLIPRPGPHWRNDFRMGFAYYKEWGRGASYTFKPSFPLCFVGDLYADAIYYSRYRNSIATARIRPGFEIFRLGTTSIDLYFRGFVIEDKRRDFFNNYLEYGPGLVWYPNDRYNIALRYELTNGHYLPAGSPSPNPYSVNYHNNVFEIDLFLRL